MIPAIIGGALTVIAKVFDFMAAKSANTAARVAALKARIAKNKDLPGEQPPK